MNMMYKKPRLIVLDNTQYDESKNAMATIQKSFSVFPTMDKKKRKRLSYMGPQGNSLARHVIAALHEYPYVVPAIVDIAQAKEDLETYDKLRSMSIQLQDLNKRLDIAMKLLGSDIMSVVRQGFDAIKKVNRDGNLEAIYQELSVYYANRGRKKSKKAETPTDDSKSKESEAKVEAKVETKAETPKTSETQNKPSETVESKPQSTDAK